MKASNTWRQSFTEGSSWSRQAKKNPRALMGVPLGSLIAIGSGFDLIARSAGSNWVALQGFGLVVGGVFLSVSYWLWARPGPLGQPKWTVGGPRLWIGLFIRHFWILTITVMAVWHYVSRSR
jgi:hypothetical protein